MVALKFAFFLLSLHSVVTAMDSKRCSAKVALLDECVANGYTLNMVKSLVSRDKQLSARDELPIMSSSHCIKLEGLVKQHCGKHYVNRHGEVGRSEPARRVWTSPRHSVKEGSFHVHFQPQVQGTVKGDFRFKVELNLYNAAGVRLAMANFGAERFGSLVKGSRSYVFDPLGPFQQYPGCIPLENLDISGRGVLQRDFLLTVSPDQLDSVFQVEDVKVGLDVCHSSENWFEMMRYADTMDLQIMLQTHQHENIEDLYLIR